MWIGTIRRHFWRIWTNSSTGTKLIIILAKTFGSGIMGHCGSYFLIVALEPEDRWSECPPRSPDLSHQFFWGSILMDHTTKRLMNTNPWWTGEDWWLQGVYTRLEQSCNRKMNFFGKLGMPFKKLFIGQKQMTSSVKFLCRKIKLTVFEKNLKFCSELNVYVYWFNEQWGIISETTGVVFEFSGENRPIGVKKSWRAAVARHL